MKFTVTIDLGNDAMRTAGDLGRALSLLGHKFVTGRERMKPGEDGKIMDTNGNSVGKWEVTEA